MNTVTVSGIVRLVTLALLLQGAALAQSPSFHHLHGGLLEGVRFIDENHGWTAEDGGRIRRTADGGETWIQATVPLELDAQVQLRGLFFLGAYDTEDFIGWAVGDGGVVLKSTDGQGQEWFDANPFSRIESKLGDGDPCEPVGAPAELYSIFMIDELDGWAVGNDGVLSRTTDGGASWFDGATNPPSVFNCGPDPYDVYCVNFFKESGTGYDDYDKGVIATEFGKLFATDDGGANWLPINIPGSLPTGECPTASGNLEIWSLKFDDPSDADSAGWAVGGVGTNKGYIFRTTGIWESNSWTQTLCYESLDPTKYIAQGNCSIPSMYSVAALGSGEPTAVAVGYGGHLLVQEEGSPNFDPCTCTPFSNPCGQGDAKWVQKSVDAGGCGELNPFYGVDRIAANKACAVGNFGRIVLYEEGAQDEVVDKATPYSARLFSGAFIDDSIGCVVGQGYSIWKTTDGGVNWTKTSNSAWDCASNQWGRDIAFSSSGYYGVVVGTDGFIAYTTDSGSTWSLANDIGTVDLNAVAFAPSEEVVYAVGADGSVWRSGNWGQFWREADSPGSDPLFGVSFSSDSEGYVVGANKKVYRTTSGATSWAAVTVTGGNQETLTDVETWGDGTKAVAVGQNGLVFEKSSTAFELVDAQDYEDLEITDELRDVQVIINGSDVDLRICGYNGVVMFRDGEAWSQPRSYSTRLLHKLSFTSSGQGFVIGQNFQILEYTN